MRLSDVKMEALLPLWMRDNEDDVSLARSVDKVIRQIYVKAQLLTIWDKLDQLPEAVLDRLAWELDVDWYDQGASYQTKVDLIRDSDFVHAHKGTVAAVEKVIAAYFGSEKLLEWFEYGGEPHHFKIFTTEPTLVAENVERFMAMLNKVKRKSSKLDSILIALTGMEWLYVGDGSRTFTHETHAMAPFLYLLTDMGSVQFDQLVISMGAEQGPHGDELVYLVFGARPMERQHELIIMNADAKFFGDLTDFLICGFGSVQRDSVRVRIGG